jgi:hypothetical protein
MPRKFAAADVIAINFRLPPQLHRALEREARRNGTSMNTEAVRRLQESYEMDRLPNHLELAQALRLLYENPGASRELVGSYIKVIEERMQEATAPPRGGMLRALARAIQSDSKYDKRLAASLQELRKRISSLEEILTGFPSQRPPPSSGNDPDTNEDPPRAPSKP